MCELENGTIPYSPAISDKVPEMLVGLGLRCNSPLNYSMAISLTAEQILESKSENPGVTGIEGEVLVWNDRIANAVIVEGDVERVVTYAFRDRGKPICGYDQTQHQQDLMQDLVKRITAKVEKMEKCAV